MPWREAVPVLVPVLVRGPVEVIAESVGRHSSHRSSMLWVARDAGSAAADERAP